MGTRLSPGGDGNFWGSGWGGGLCGRNAKATSLLEVTEGSWGLVGGGPPFLPAQEDGVTAGRGWGLGVGAGRTGAHSRGRP